MSHLYRSMRSLVSGLVLGVGAIALDAPAMPDLSPQDPWAIRPIGDDVPLEGGSRLDALPAGLDESRPVLELGEIPFDTGAFDLTRGTLSEDDTALPSGSRPGVNNDPSSTGTRFTGDNNTQPTAWETTFKEISWQMSSLAGPQWSSLGGPSERPLPRSVEEPGSQADDLKPHELRWILDEARRVATHPLAILVVLVLLGGWLTAKVLTHVERLRTAGARAPQASRAPTQRRRRRRRSRR